MAESLDFGSLSIREAPEPQEELVVQITQPSTMKFIEAGGNIMVVMRGVAGTGKSTIVKHLMEKLDTNCVCSADHYFIKNGAYVYDRTKIKLAHENCQQKAKLFCEQGHGVVIIDNTHVKRWETNFYLDLAHEQGYVVVIITPNAQFNTSPVILSQRNKHGVTASVIEEKQKEFSTINPLYFAWFFDKASTRKLLKIRDDVLDKLTKAGINRLTYSNTKTIAHVTSLYVGGIKDEARRQKATANMNKHIGNIAQIEVVAIVATKRTISARVKLHGAAKTLYFNDDRNEGEHGINTELPGYESLPKGHAAHITLGLTHGIQAREAKSDMILSRLCHVNGTEIHTYDDNITFYPTQHVAVVVLNSPIRLDSMFAGGYR